MAGSLRSQKLAIDVGPTGLIAITDAAKGVRWGGSVPGWVTLSSPKGTFTLALSASSVEARAGAIHVEFGPLASRELGKVPFGMTAVLALDDRGLELEIRELTCAMTLVSVEYPAHLFTTVSGTADCYVAVPFKQGVLIPSRLDAGFMRFMHNAWRAISDVERVLPFDSGSLNMPWFGASAGGSSMFAHVATSADCSLHVVGNAVVSDEGFVVNARQGQNPGTRICSLAPVWLASHGGLGAPRRLRVEPVADGYVGMAKRYLEISRANGRYKSLREKIGANPLAERIVGAPDVKIYVYTHRPDTPYFRAWSEPVLNGYTAVHTTFEQVGRMASDLKNEGFQRALMLLGGWNRAGYDREHVDMWPPAQAAGGAEGLAAASREATGKGYLLSLHDNYQDFYVEAPSYHERYLMKHPDGSVHLGGVWDGGLCRLICSSQAFELAERNLDLIQKATAINSYYLDTTTAARLYECFDAAHPLTRSEDRANKLALLQMLAKRGLIVGGEGGTDWAVPVCSFFEGLPGSSVGFFGGIESTDFGIAAPLFNLVYHDAVVCYWQHGQPFGREDHANHVLHDLASGQPSSWSLVYEQWADLLPLIRQSYGLLGSLHARTAHHPMTSHEYLSADFAAQRTRFGEGSEVVVNFGIRSVEVGGHRVPPKGFRLEVPGEAAKVGALSRDIVYR